MDTIIEKPEMSPLKVGSEFKTFTVSGKKGMKMPQHISTQEAVVIVQEGSALLKIDGEEQTLEKDGVYIIPAKKPHSLSLLADFKAIGLMALEAEIEFV